MTKHCDWGLFQLHRGNNVELLRGMADASVDSVVTDPPYELGFMGKAWDRRGTAYSVDLWRECLRVLKPGGYLLAFGGTRTFHRVAVAIEDAGFELRDTIMWVYGSGFPKSHNGPWGGTALKPAWEPITMARKPLAGTVEANWREHGTGALNIDGCRVEPTGESRERVGEASQERRYTEAGGTNFAATPGVRGGDPAGRWPANLIHDGSDEVLAAFPQAPGQQGDLKGHAKERRSPNGCFGKMAPARDHAARGDAGSAARFFYCAKASQADRDEGMADAPDRILAQSCQAQAQLARGVLNVAKPGSSGLNSAKVRKNNHPTVKPTALMRYLVRLVTPRGGVVLDVFNGSGSTGKAAVLEGMRYVGLELDEDGDGNPIGYLEISERRIAHAAFGPAAFGEAA